MSFSWNCQVFLTVTLRWSLGKIPKFFCDANWDLNTYSGVLQYMKIHYKVSEGNVEIMFTSGLISDCQYEVFP